MIVSHKVNMGIAMDTDHIRVKSDYVHVEGIKPSVGIADPS